MIITPEQGYDFSKLLAVLKRFPQPSLFHIADTVLWRTVRIGENICLLRYEALPGGISVEVCAGQNDLDEQTIYRKATRIIGTDIQHNNFYNFARQHAKLWRVVEPLIGLPVERSESVFQALIFVIIEQHIAWTAAQNAQRRLVEWANQRIDYQGYSHYATPAPEQLANATLDKLKPLKITFKRMQLLIDIARAVVSRSLDLEALSAQSPQAMYQALLKIKGVGHWTASVVVSRAMGIYPYVAHNDVALQAAVRRYFYDDEQKKSAAMVKETFEKYGSYAGLAAHYTLMRWVLDEYPVRN